MRKCESTKTTEIYVKISHTSTGDDSARVTLRCLPSSLYRCQCIIAADTNISFQSGSNGFHNIKHY